MHPAQLIRAFATQNKFTSRISAVKGLYRLGVLFILVVLIGSFVYSSSRASGNTDVAPAAQATLNGSSPVISSKSVGERFHPNYFNPAAPLVAPLLAAGVTIQESTCNTAQVNFNLNDGVCITVSGAESVGQRLVVVDPQNLIRQEATISTDPQVESFQIPNTASTPLFGGFLNENNLGTWYAYVVTGNNLPLAGASFVVKDGAQATSNVEIFTVRTGGELILSGETATYDITMVNYGPDAAVNATFTNPTPAFTTFASVTGPINPPSITCTDPGVGNTGDVVCTVASLAPDTRVTFTVQYQVGTVGVGSSIGVSATLSTDTANISTKTTANSTGSVSTDTAPSGCTLTCPANIVVTADTTGIDPADPSPTPSPVPGAIVTFSTTSGGTCGTVTSSPASGSFFPIGTTTVTSSSSQGGGECSFTVTVTQSGDAVSIACPSNKIANADANCSAIVSLGTPTTTGDNVTIFANRSDGLPMFDCDINGENCVRKSQDLPFSVGVTTITWTASNSSGSESCTQTVTVYDVTAPTITATDSTASADANCLAAVPDYSAAAFDNCSCASSDASQICDSRLDITVSQDVAPGTLVGLGPHTIHLIANDGAVTPGPDGIIGTADDVQGNVAVKTITFTVVDTTAPTFTFVPANVTAYTGPGASTCDTVVDPGVATATDNCSAVTITRSPTGNTFPVGTTTIVWTAKDEALNAATASQTVTVIDNTPPVISCPSNIVLEPTCPSGAIGTYATPVGTDNCPGVTTSLTAGLASGSVFPIGTTTTVTYTANDAHGNSTSCSFTVTVKTVAQTIADLRTSVSNSSLSGTQRQGLIAKLDAATDALAKGNTNTACQKLADFINSTQNYIDHGDLSAAVGNAWISTVAHVRNTIGCTNNPCS